MATSSTNSPRDHTGAERNRVRPRTHAAIGLMKTPMVGTRYLSRVAYAGFVTAGAE